MCLFLGAVHREGSGERQGPGPPAEDPDAVGGLLFIGGQDSPDHTGGELQPKYAEVHLSFVCITFTTILSASIYIPNAALEFQVNEGRIDYEGKH